MRNVIAAGVLLASASAVWAQVSQPFDMSPERGVEIPAAPAAPAPPAAVVPPPAPAEPAVPAPSDPSPRAETPAEPRRSARRNLLPFADLSLTGETDRRSWSVHLTAEQASSPARLHLAYQNAIVVAPEGSALELTVNGTSVLSQAVQSSDAVAEISVEVPPGVLKPGGNLVSIAATMRHRTDCTVQSTYELWASIDPARTYLEFAAPEAARFRRVGDIAAIGVDEAGATRFDIVVPTLDRLVTTASTMRLAEGLALIANMPNQSVRLAPDLPDDSGAGRMTVLVGTATELAALVPNLPQEAATASIARFVETDAAGGSMLVVSGPDWGAVDAAIDTILQPVQRQTGTRRAAVSTATWRAPDAPLFFDEGRQNFVALGVPTQEFSGRRFTTEFGFGVPSDFYSNDYGHAQLRLDAAYSAEVLPGSHIDIYVNSNIAATVPITQTGGGILRHFPVEVTMRHFRPGANVVTIEAVLSTEADEICSPGTTGSEKARFALFDTSEFVMPQFARVGRRPDLGALAGTGYPYGQVDAPLALFVDDSSAETLSAAATLLGKLSVAAGRPVAIETAANPTSRNALFIDAKAALQPAVLSQVGLSGDLATSWAGDSTAEAGAGTSTDAAFEKWRDELSGSGWRGRVSRFEDWVSRTFDVQLGAERLAGGGGEFNPGPSARLVVAQQQAPSANATWTVVAARSAGDLDDAVTSLVRQDTWSRMTGQIATLDVTMQDVSTIAPAETAFAGTQPLSFRNVRLIIANWLSANPASYAAALFLLCLLLGLATALFLSSLGRRD